MRSITKLLALSSIFVLPLAAGCGDDSDGDSPSGSGATSNQGGDGGTSGKGGSAGKGGSGNTGNTGGDGTGNTGGDGTGNTGNMGGDTSTAGAGGNGPEVPACDLDNLEDGGALPASGEVEGGYFYEIDGRTDVLSGEVLTIGPCTKILGSGTDDVIVVQPGGQLVAEGTADAPIVFTSAEANPAPGDWGGIVLAGNAVCNDATADTKCTVEGFASDPPVYGNTADDAVNDESSGSLKYVRIEYPGVDLGGGKEINGLSLAGIGSGTTLSHIMISHALDDCFEFFGGTVNADHLICYDPGDDMFDTDQGFSGHVQFAFGRQLFPGDSDASGAHGFEMDNDSTTFDKAPISSPKFSNVTLCGTNQAEAGTPNLGGNFRRGTAGALMNVLITGFETAAYSVRDNDPTVVTTITLTDSTAWDNNADSDGDNALDDTWFADEATNSTTEPENFGDCYADPPAPFPAAAIAGGTPTGFADDGAEFQGAFEDADDNWMTTPWVSWD